MTLNTSDISSAQTHDPHFNRPTWTQTQTHTHTHTHTHTQKGCRKQLLGFKSSPAPPASLTRAGTSEQGSACRGRTVAEWPVFEGGLWLGRVSGRGSALLEVLDTSGKAFSLPRSEAEWLSFIFLSLSHQNGKIMSKKHVTGIFPGRDSINSRNPTPEDVV